MTYTITELQVIEQAKRISELEAARLSSEQAEANAFRNRDSAVAENEKLKAAVHMYKAALDWMWEFLPLDDGPIGPDDGDHESQWIAAEIEAARIRSPLYSPSSDSEK